MSDLVRLLQAQVFRIVFYQLILIMGFTLIIFCLKGIQNGLSAFGAAMTYWLPTLIYVWRLSAHAGARALMRFMVAFFMGEILKLSLCGILFLILIKYLDMSLIYALAGLFGAIVAFWVASFTSLYYVKDRNS